MALGSYLSISRVGGGGTFFNSSPLLSFSGFAEVSDDPLHKLLFLFLGFYAVIKHSTWPRFIIVASSTQLALTLSRESYNDLLGLAVLPLFVAFLWKKDDSVIRQQATQIIGEKTQRVVLEERTRIARDLHDIVAHHMSMVVVQAETAVYRLPDLPESARIEFASIGDSARAALTETRSLLSVLRQDSESPMLLPQPGLSLLPQLVSDARRVGQHVELHCPINIGSSAETEPVDDLPAIDIPPGVGLAAYRIIQESLSNAARHANGSQVRVSVEIPEQVQEETGQTMEPQLLVTVINGPVTSATAAPAVGDAVGNADAHGIIGMRERAAAEGGSFAAYPTDDGGFLVRATFPLSRNR